MCHTILESLLIGLLIAIKNDRVTDKNMTKNGQKLSKNACSAHDYLTFLEKFMCICHIFSDFILFSNSALNRDSKMVCYKSVTSKLK